MFPFIAAHCSGVSPRGFLLLTFLKTRSSAGVLGVTAPPDLLPVRGVLLEAVEPCGVPLELGVVRWPLRTPNGVLGGEVMHGLQSLEVDDEPLRSICLINANCCRSDMGVWQVLPVTLTFEVDGD